MDNQIPVNNVVVVGGVFGALLLGMLLLEVVQPVTREAVVPAVPAATQPQPPDPVPQAPAVDIELKEREIKSEIDRLRFELDGYRRELDVAEQRERENDERFKRASLEQQAPLLGEGVRLGNQSLKAGNKVRDTEFKIRAKQNELQDLYKAAKR
jgi:hypothetical protein